LLEYSLAFSKRSAVIAAFGEEFAKTGDVAAKLRLYLTEGQESRHGGDYSFGSGLAQGDAALQIERGQKFLEFGIQRLGPLPPAREAP